MYNSAIFCNLPPSPERDESPVVSDFNQNCKHSVSCRVDGLFSSHWQIPAASKDGFSMIMRSSGQLGWSVLWYSGSVLAGDAQWPIGWSLVSVINQHLHDRCPKG